MDEQKSVASSTAEFIDNHGLKVKYVAERVNLQGYIFSKFLHNRLALSKKQLQRVQDFVSDYTQRMA